MWSPLPFSWDNLSTARLYIQKFLEDLRVPSLLVWGKQLLLITLMVSEDSNKHDDWVGIEVESTVSMETAKTL